ncbi:sodium-coupled neutral amino acid transporter 9 homolog isoform X2 [Colias croceus]|uniref:sodium-coupled neutral amino acid transporter 9 homolog isoform X2 n=1 Tax=Colias crocea TaxID=72248 RepID=UPI001E27A932|nr:sodium-coupled neutral amino acid transporter 9 homolog isoform X2 [Colias croceus]
MRFKRNNNDKSGDESAASSVRSTDSYGVFGSACSDFSECEDGEERKRGCRYTQIPSVSTSSASFQSAMERETAPLLLAPSYVPAYKSIHCISSDTLGPGELSDADIIATYKRTFEKPNKPAKKRQSSLVTIFSIWNTIMGSSLLTMAWGVERAGLPAALLLLAFMAGLCLYTAYLLLKVNLYHGGDSYEVPSLCRALLGPLSEMIAHAFSLLVLVGANVVYWVLITNFLYYTVNYFIEPAANITTFNSSLMCPKNDLIGPLNDVPVHDPSPYWGLHTTVPFYVAIIVFPLLNFRNVSFFTKFNSLGTLSVLYLLVFVIVKGYSWGLNFTVSEAPHRGTDAAVLSGMLALSFYIHNIIITIMTNNERQDRNGRDLTIAFLLVTVTYTIVGAVFYICFPLAKSCIEDNILNNFEMHDVMTVVARALLLFQVITVYPLVVYMLRTEALLLLPLKESRAVTLFVNLLLVSLSILVACLCPNVGTIIRYTGAVSGLVHVFTLPALLYMRSLYIRRELTLWKTIFYTAIILFGTVNLFMQFFIE